MENIEKECSIFGKIHNKKELESFSINQWDGFCHSGETIYLCAECFENNIIMTEKGMFLTYNGYLFHYRPCCFTRVNSKYEIDQIFNKDYIDILNLFEKQNYDREMKYKNR